MDTSNLGQKGEIVASKFLEKQDYKIITRNFHSKFGEIDIIAQDKDTLVFVEVKTRWNQKFGPPEEAITPWKIKAIIKTGEYYKLLNPRTPELLRVDAVAIDMDGKEVKDIRLLKNISQ